MFKKIAFICVLFPVINFCADSNSEFLVFLDDMKIEGGQIINLVGKIRDASNERPDGWIMIPSSTGDRLLVVHQVQAKGYALDPDLNNDFAEAAWAINREHQKKWEALRDTFAEKRSGAPINNLVARPEQKEPAIEPKPKNAQPAPLKSRWTKFTQELRKRRHPKGYDPVSQRETE